jgi:hypothetical protein
MQSIQSITNGMSSLSATKLLTAITPHRIDLDNVVIAQFTWRGEPESALYWVMQLGATIALPWDRLSHAG